MNGAANSKPPAMGDILAIGFGTTVAMWTAGYVCRLPSAAIPSSVLLVILVACLLAGGFVAGRYTLRGWRGGLLAGLVSAVLNLLILGSLLADGGQDGIVPSAALWLPGSFIVAGGLGLTGALIGSLKRSPFAAPYGWTAVFARVAAAAVLLLVVVGGVVTSKAAGLAVDDWPNTFGRNMFLYPLSRMTGGIYYEHAHRLIGSLVGLITIVLAVHLQLVERRRWVRILAWAALLVVVVQGIMGGLRVTGRFTLSAEGTSPSTMLAVVHGVVGQVFWGLAVVLSVVTGVGWRDAGDPVAKPSAGLDRRLSVVLVAMIVVQLIVGAALRHTGSGLHLHITVAVFIAVVALVCGMRAWGAHADLPRLPSIGTTLLVLTAAQALLGLSALIAINMTADVQPPPAIDVILSTAHQVLGAILLACALVLMLWLHRLLGREPVQI